MGAQVTNSLTTQQPTTAGGGTSTAAAVSTSAQTQALEDVFVALAEVLIQSSAGGSSLMSQGGQSSPGLSNTEIHALADFAAAFVEALEGGSPSTGAATSGGTLATTSTSQTNPAPGTGNNSNTNSTFTLSVAPALSANKAQCTQAGVDAINNMPSSTLANVNINQYTHDAMVTMQGAGYSQDQISAYMTGLYQEYNSRTTPTGGGSTPSSGGSQTQRTPYQPQQPLRLNTVNPT